MAEDEAGPLIGWSLGTGLKKRPIEELVDFPCRYAFKAVGEASEDFVRSLLVRVGNVLGRKVEDTEVKIRRSAKGNYQSVTLEVFVTSGAEVYEVYAAIRDDDRVRYMF